MTTSDTPVRKHLARRRLALTTALFLLLAALLPAAASADFFKVTNGADSGTGSLREAITGANTHPGDDSIGFEPTGGTISLASELPKISGGLSIDGPGEQLTVRRNPAAGDFRVFDIGMVPVTISGLTIAGGKAAGGGGIRSEGELTLVRVRLSENQAFVSGGANAVAAGGGILALGKLVLREATVVNNSALAINGTGLTHASDGGVLAHLGASVMRSTIARNSAEASSAVGVVQANAGGIEIGEAPAHTIEASTVSENFAGTSGGAVETHALAGGVEGEAELTILGSTITGNSVSTAKFVGGANLEFSGAATIRDSIVADPHGGPSCGRHWTSGGFNVDADGSCGLALPTDLSNVDAKVDPNLADNGGPTQTHALLPGSPAIDHGNGQGASVDQRNLARVSDFPALANASGGDGSDSGAFELQVPTATPSPAPSPAPTPPAPDRTAPQTRIAHGPAHLTANPLAVFRFASSEAGSRFQCKLDKAAYRACASPYKRKVKAGARHLLLVRAVDAAGNVDATPARYAWRVKPRN